MNTIGLNKIKKALNKYSQITFFVLIFYGLSISIFLKELNIFFFQDSDFNILIVYRFLIVFSSIFFLFFMKKEANIFLLLFSLLHFVFFYNSFFGTEIKFYMNAHTFYDSITVKVSDVDQAFNKNKLITINLLNILLPLIILSFCKNINFTINDFKSISLKLCNIFLYFVLIYIFYKYLLTNIKSFDYDDSFINIHGMIYILNIHFILILDSLKNLKIIENKKNFLKLTLIFICFLLSGTTIHLALSFLSLITYMFIFGIKKKNLYLILFFLLFLFIISFTQIIYLDTYNFLDYTRSGTGLNAIYVRMMNIYFFLFFPINFNFILGNNIFVENIVTYPHNIFIDIFMCTGLFGCALFLALIVYISKHICKNLSRENFFIVVIFVQSFLFANLSGFVFSNTIFNFALAASFLFLKKTKLIKK